MENTKRLYIVSFGDSRKYRMFYDGDMAAASHNPLLTEVEQELNAYLKEKFPEDPSTYYTTPKVVEVDWNARGDYESYPILDKDAVADLKGVLTREIKDMNSVDELDDNAPYADAPLD